MEIFLYDCELQSSASGISYQPPDPSFQTLHFEKIVFRNKALHGAPFKKDVPLFPNT